MRIWSSWTAVDVWLTGIVSPLLISGELGLPGSSSMKKLPSRKIRGRISAKASLWIGLPAPLDREADHGGVAVPFGGDHFADFDAGDADG